MPEWDALQYLKFERERAQACVDLVARLRLTAPRSVVDIGCGTGLSTRVLRRRWPDAQLVGVDSSAEMLEQARAEDPSVRWVRSDLREWAPDGRPELVFSNGVLQWVPDHPREVRRLWSWVAPGGALAFQVPARGEPPPAWRAALTAVQGRAPWRDRAAVADPTSTVLSLAEYYDLLASEADTVEVWDTDYHHALSGPPAVVEWGKGTVLRPWLEGLPSDAEREEFLRQYADEVAARYPRRADGRVLFPFLRRFVVAYRPG